MPDLLFGVHHIDIPSSTSESVSILVNVDEQTNCDGVEGLTILATLSAEGAFNTIVSRQPANYYHRLNNYLGPYLLVNIPAL